MKKEDQKKIFISQKIPPIGLEILERAKLSYTIWNRAAPITQKELVKECQNVQGLLSMVTDNLDATFLKKCSHLKIISQFGVGLNNIDLPAAKELGIAIANTPDVLTQATAELTMGLILATARRFKQASNDLLQGHFGHWRPCDYLGTGLRGKTLGIYGMGRIGTAVATIAKNGFAMKIIYHSRRIQKSSLGESVPFEDLLKMSDVLSIHCDLNKTTEGLFSEKAFAAMRPNALFINTARGAIHNTEALHNALTSQQILAAGLDVTHPEPLPPKHKSLDLPNLLILPHIGSATIEARGNMSLLACKNLYESLCRETFDNRSF